MNRRQNFIKNWIKINYIEGGDDEYGNIDFVTAEAEKEYFYDGGYEDALCGVEEDDNKSEYEFETVDQYYEDTREIIKESIWTKEERDIIRALLEINKTACGYKLTLCQIHGVNSIDVDILTHRRLLRISDVNEIIQTVSKICDIKRCEVTYNKDIYPLDPVIIEWEYQTKDFSVSSLKSKSLAWHCKRITKLKLML
jgi:hypothetical protein